MSNLITYYEENKDKDWEDWLSYDRTFEKPGKQGLVGLLNIKGKEEKCVFKISQYINYLVNHEYTIMKGLNELSEYCPHFSRTIGIINCKVEPKCRKEGNPFEIISKFQIEKEVLLNEYVEKSYKFYNYIKSAKIKEEVLYSTIKQVLMALIMAQNKKKFSHYDLHSCNILMKKCDKDEVYVYVIDEENQFCIPTNGYYPVIIDYGFSYIEDMEDAPLWISLAHTDVGFMSDRFDKFADPKLFLVTVSEEIKIYRKSKKSKILRNIVRNIFDPLSIDWKSGWDKDKRHRRGAADNILEKLRKFNCGSKIFDDYDHYCIDIIQSLIILPLEKQDYIDIDKSYVAFLKEWIKIENTISNPFYNLYILKGLVDSAREVRPYYINKKERDYAIQMFKKSVYMKIDEVSSFCRPKKINFEIMLCSLLILAKCAEGILYEIIDKRMGQKEEDYKKLPLQTIEQMYAAIEVNISDNYIFNENTKIHMYDSVSKKTNIFKPELKDIEIINNLHSLSRGSFLYDLYKSL